MYQHGKRTARPKNSKVFLYAAFILGLSLVIIALVLQKDLATDTKERTTVPIITEVSEQKEDVININEPLFSMQLPADWIETKEVHEHYANFYEWHSTKQGGNDRRLLLHIDILPKSYKLTRLLPLTVNGNKFNLGTLSIHCAEFATNAGSRDKDNNAPVEAKWENVSFVCDPIEANQTIGTGTVDGGIGAKIGGHTYFFYYEDHNIRPDDKILQNAIRSFQAK